jgi:DNA-binding IscR family transcriptional regulator
MISAEKLHIQLGWCNCASDETTDIIIKVIEDLRTNEGKEFYYTDIAKRLGLEPVTVEIILLELDRIEVIEHGTSVRGSWILNTKPIEE